SAKTCYLRQVALLLHGYHLFRSKRIRAKPDIMHACDVPENSFSGFSCAFEVSPFQGIGIAGSYCIISTLSTGVIP
ncbi:MAG: hypothetical protein KDH84_20390, partial [Calditrichaeota bacterium]|nr:hypothetical protein [Calditrichota bacterium]